MYVEAFSQVALEATTRAHVSFTSNRHQQEGVGIEYQVLFVGSKVVLPPVITRSKQETNNKKPFPKRQLLLFLS